MLHQITKFLANIPRVTAPARITDFLHITPTRCSMPPPPLQNHPPPRPPAVGEGAPVWDFLGKIRRDCHAGASAGYSLGTLEASPPPMPDPQVTNSSLSPPWTVWVRQVERGGMNVQFCFVGVIGQSSVYLTTLTFTSIQKVTSIKKVKKVFTTIKKVKKKFFYNKKKRTFFLIILNHPQYWSIIPSYIKCMIRYIVTLCRD